MYPTLTHCSKNLSWAEMACKDGTHYPLKWRETRAVELAAEFERIRAVVGAPIIVGSAYRTPTHNSRVGGAKASQHMEGRALDLYPPKAWTVDRFYGVIREIAGMEQSKIYGIGRYQTFVHVDIRPPRADGKLTAWRGNRAWAEVKAA